MNVEDFRHHCLAVKGATESFPFGKFPGASDVLAFKVMDRMFAFLDLNPRDGRFGANLKCDPVWAVELRERYHGITGGTHEDSPHWNAVWLNSDVPDELIAELIRHSAAEVIRKLPKVKQKAYFEESL